MGINVRVWTDYQRESVRVWVDYQCESVRESGLYIVDWLSESVGWLEVLLVFIGDMSFM